VDGQECDGGNRRYDAGEQDDDEPRGALCCLRGGLGDPHSVDKGVRDEQEEVHVSSLRTTPS
jgi:hypothetical protein